MAEKYSLMFLDTFNHNALEMNLDLIQFANPVCIQEIRVIPLGNQVTIGSLGKRLGATNPAQFNLDIFVNNLSQKKAPTFQNIGRLEFQELNTRLLTYSRIPTDGLIIKGWFTTATVAIYGYPADQLPPIQLDPTIQRIESFPDPISSRSNDTINSALLGVISSTEDINHDSDDIDMDSQDYVLAGDIITTDETGYDEYEAYESNNFSPYQYEATQLMTYNNPALTEFENHVFLLKTRTSVSYEGTVAEKLVHVINEYTQQPHHNEWIMSIESVLGSIPEALARLHLTNPTTYGQYLQCLIEWTLEGLDLESAMLQPLPPFKVRHLKMGLKLAEKMLTLSDEITDILLQYGVEDMLFILLNSDHMVASIKLQVMRTLDAMTSMPSGATFFISGMEGRLSGYQQVIDCMSKKQETRVMVAFTAFLQKLHYFEIIVNFQTLVNSIHVKTKELLTKAGPQIATDPDEKLEGDDQANIVIEPMSDEEAAVLVAVMQELRDGIQYANQIMAQPPVCKPPSQKYFKAGNKTSDPYQTIYRLLNSVHFVELINALISSPYAINHESVFNKLRELILLICERQEGLLLLQSSSQSTNNLVKTLLSAGDYDKDNEIEDNPLQVLGLHLIYRFQTLQLLDQIKSYMNEHPESCGGDNDEFVALIHVLYSLTVIPVGREALCDVSGFDIKPYIKMITKPGVRLNTGGSVEEDVKLTVNVTFRYIVDILVLTLQYTDNIKLLEPEIPQLIQIVNAYTDKKVAAPLTEWLEPYREVDVYEIASIPHLTKLFHSYTEQLPKLEYGVLTCLRLMHKLAIDEPLDHMRGLITKELCYQHALLELYSNDCLGHWTKLLEHIGERYLNSWQRGVALSISQRDFLISIVSSTLTLVKRILCQLIAVRGREFKDTSCLLSLYKIFTVICVIPMGGLYTDTIDQIQTDIVDILAAFTQPEVPNNEKNINDVLDKSLWSEMIKRLLTFTISQPCYYLSGTLLLSELLPIQLPIQTRTALSKDEVDVCVNKRTLWSAHLLPACNEIEQFINTVSVTSCHHLQHAVRRVCAQLADINSHFSQFITEVLLKNFTSSLLTPNNTDMSGIDPTDSQNALLNTEIRDYEADVAACNIMSILSQLAGQPPVKTALLHFLRHGEKIGFDGMFNKILYTLNFVSEKPSHNQCQEDIVSLLSSLCDMELSLTDELAAIDEQISNELPDKRSLQTIVSSILTHIGNIDHGYNSILLSLRTLVIFTDYDHTFNCLKRVLLRDNTSLFNLFTRINDTFSKDSSDCISTLSTALDLLRLLVSTDSSAQQIPGARTQIVTELELAQLINWGKLHHPLDDLEKLLVDLVEASLEGVVSNITHITGILRSLTPEDIEKQEQEYIDSDRDDSSPQIPLSIIDKFDRRSVYVITIPDEEKSQPAYWLTNLMAEDSDCEEIDSRTNIDLLELCEKQLKEFNLEQELKNADSGVDKTKVHVIRQRNNDILAMNQEGKSYVAPMRGKGVMIRGRGMRRGADTFRNRPPNTNRPPSIHVDNFKESEDGGGTDEAMDTVVHTPMRGIYGDRGRTRFATNPEMMFGSPRGGRGMRGTPSSMYSRGGTRGGRIMTSRTVLSSPTASIRADRRIMGPPMNRYPPEDMDRRYDRGDHRDMPGRSSGFYSRDSRMALSSRIDRDRPNHYRSFTK